MEQDVGFPISARTIYQQYQGLFAWVNLQQSIIPLVIGVIVLVASFNIIGILLMMILEKTREIGVLGSLGASGRQLRRLFLTLGAQIGVIGIGIGELLALVLGYVQMRFEIIPLPAEAYYMSTAPVSLNPLDFLLVAAVAFILCLAAAYIPARVASRIEPVKAIRFE
jgi:lipoprotein-releasing system permease protein